MRILVANANTTAAITEACVAAACAAASPGTEIIGATPAFGPRVIATRVENAIAGYAVLETLADYAGRVDAAILAVSHDTALEAARQLMPCPVLGMTEAACLTACTVGGRFAILTLGRPEPYEELVARHGLAVRCATVLGVPMTPQDVLADPAAAELALTAAIEGLAGRAESVILAGAVLAGMDRTLQPTARLPLLDGMSCAVRLAEMLVRLNLPRPAAGSYAPLNERESVGLSDTLAALRRGD